MTQFKRLAMVCSLAATVLMGVGGVALAADTPPALNGANVVSAEEVKALQATGAVIVDNRIASEFSDGHIKGAINIPYREKSDKSVTFDMSQDEFATSKLPSNTATALVFYCNGPSCWKGYKASVAAMKAGYKNINWFRDGFPAWQAKGLAVE